MASAVISNCKRSADTSGVFSGSHLRLRSFNKATTSTAVQQWPVVDYQNPTLMKWMLQLLDTVFQLFSVVWIFPIYESCRQNYQETSLDPFSFQAKKRKVKTSQLRPCSVHVKSLPARHSAVKCFYWWRSLETAAVFRGTLHNSNISSSTTIGIVVVLVFLFCTTINWTST